MKIISNPRDPARVAKIHDWCKWFAWYPVTVNNERIWLKTVYRRECSRHTFAGSKYWYEYTTMFNMLKD